MDIRRLPADEDAVRRYIGDLWVPYARELEAIVDGFALAENVDFTEKELPFWLDSLESESYRVWIAVDGAPDGEPIAETDDKLAGFIATDVDECSPSFDRPRRLIICDFYVEEVCRGSGLAHDLVDRARLWARENECPEFKLEVDVGNDRALAFYEKLGFEPARYTMVASVN